MNSLAARSLLAVALMVGFYALALAIAGALLWIPYAEIAYLHRVHGKLALLCLAGAGTVLWSILPRRERFAPPGPDLTAAGHPRLFAEIEKVAQATGQAMPAEVYAIPEVNAWVGQRGGLMGFGSRRIMGLGLPLMQALTIPELRAVLAHEFGHYHGGDVRLGPWIYRTRQAIGRTLEGLKERDWLRKPFQAYGTLFLRVTHAVSRRQEFTADALACRVAGSVVLRSGLRKLAATDEAFRAYLREEVGPVVGDGFAPPLTEGFRRFMATERVAGAMERIAREDEDASRTDPYDTHPCLKDRLEAAAKEAPGPAPADGRPAVALLEDLPGLEARLYASWVGQDDLKPVPWEEIGPIVFVPRWERALAKSGGALAGKTLADLPALARAGLGLPGAPSVEEDLTQSRWLLGAALGKTLHAAGWAIESPPGEPIKLRRGVEAVDPFGVAQTLAEGPTDPAGWTARLSGWGLKAGTGLA